ncbi:hypothetical protein MHY87_03515 [Microvirga sp. ACRRW]|uniref:hypothetical protein n=1 Tax=Microvirga sp. ACRRW TaxID=2918205 RepID=UPI001EF653BD|nr:hypothetical protein [Microvirga sp. ACRRW]MCG7391969.1 hypothetical protein [Microvirga sp. ACRRW]
MLEVHTITEASTTDTGVRFFVGVITDRPEVAMDWATKLKALTAGATAHTPVTLPDFVAVNPTVKEVISQALDEGENLDPNRYDAVFKVLAEVTLAGPDKRISISDLAQKVGLQKGTIRTMNTKLSMRIGRVLGKKAHEIKHATPPFPVLQRKIDALLNTKWTNGNPEYRLTGSALPAIQEWLSKRA